MLVQTLRVDGVAFTCQINLMLLFQVVVEGAGYALGSQTRNQIGADPAIFQNDWFSTSDAEPLEIDSPRSSPQTERLPNIVPELIGAVLSKSEELRPWRPTH